MQKCKSILNSQSEQLCLLAIKSNNLKFAVSNLQDMRTLLCDSSYCRFLYIDCFKLLGVLSSHSVFSLLFLFIGLFIINPTQSTELASETVNTATGHNKGTKPSLHKPGTEYYEMLDNR